MLPGSRQGVAHQGTEFLAKVTTAHIIFGHGNPVDNHSKTDLSLHSGVLTHPGFPSDLDNEGTSWAHLDFT